MENGKNQGNATQGFKIIIVVLAVVVAAVSILFYTNVSSLKKESEQLKTEKIALQENLSQVSDELGSIKTTNESLSATLESEKARIEQLMADLEKEKTNSKAAIRKYKREADNMRALIKKYVAQIEQLNAENKKLTAENLKVKTDLKNTTLRAEAAERDAKNLSDLVRKGQVVVAREIELTPVKKNDKETSRIKRARKLKIDFTLVSNNIAKAGNRVIYARLIGPDGYVMTVDQNDLFEYNGERISYTASREVDYQNADLKVSVYLDGVKGLSKGTYTVQVYMDGVMIGSKEIASR